MSYPRYPEYRDSGVEWLGEVPKHWESLQIGRIFQQSVETDHPDLPILSVSIHHGISDRELTQEESERKQQKSENRSLYKLVKEGDIAYNMMRAWQGAFGASTVDGIVSPAYTIARPFKPIASKYYELLLRTDAGASESKRYSRGITDFRLRLYWDEFKTITVPLPPLPEQRQIAAFLDRECAAMDDLMAKQERLIALLKEKRQALISHTVTKGLDSQAKLKDSGIEWLGQVPEGWKIVALKHTATADSKAFTDGDWIESPFITDEGVRLLQTGNVGVGEFREKGFRYVSKKTFVALRCTPVYPNDVLICRLDGPVGRACLAPELGVEMITSVDNAILKTSEDVDSAFIVHSLSSNEWLEWIQDNCRVGGGFRFRISRSMLGDERIPLPPLAEQRAIVAYLDEACGKIDSLVAKAESAITLLKERRTALISAAVTGKIDVRDL